LNKFGIQHQQIETLVQHSGLLSFCNIVYDTIENGWVFAFVNKWHRELSNFHLFVGEMIITLDDVSKLLHIQLFMYVTLDATINTTILVEL